MTEHLWPIPGGWGGGKGTRDVLTAVLCFKHTWHIQPLVQPQRATEQISNKYLTKKVGKQAREHTLHYEMRI